MKNLFEEAFSERLGQSPVDFIFRKLLVGSDKKAVEYLYDIMAAEIARKNHCKVKPFCCFYPEAEKRFQKYLMEKDEQNRFTRQQCNIHKCIEICQREFLNRRDSRPFGAQCGSQMDLLYADISFCNSITQIGKENSNLEFCDNPKAPEFLRFKREILPRRMAELGLTEHPVVRTICDYAASGGKAYKSALITIYYAVRMHTLKRLVEK